MSTILMLEDSMVFGTLIKEKIETKLNWTVVWKKSHEDIIEYIENSENSCFATVLDLDLGRQKDFDLIDYVISKDISVIVCSSEFSDDAQDKMWSKKIVDYILKAGRCSVNLIVDSLKRLMENSETKILVVDDSSVARESISELLRVQNYIILEAHDGIEALKIMEENPDIKLTLTDYFMPEMDGYELTKAVRQRYPKDVHAVIGISGQGSNRLSAKFLKYGANDFISKPFVVEELYCKINQNLDMIKSMEAVRHAAMFDYLTSIYNRRYLFQAGSILLENARRSNLDVLVAVIDVDNFKKVNDTHGHVAGDKVLLEISSILKSRFRESDIVARLGGEEFAVFAMNMGKGSICDIFNDLRKMIEKKSIHLDSNEEISVTISIGICSELKDSLDEMINIADKKMYEAKVAGKNKLCTDII